MPLCRLTGSDRLIQQTAATRSAGAVPGRRHAHAHLASATQAHLAREQNSAVWHERSRPGAAAGPLDNHAAAGRARLERPRFARLHASIIERQADWGWHNSPDSAQAPGESGRTPATPAEPSLSARKLWVGGIALALLAAGVISAIATVQSGRMLPFEAWARGDLMQLVGVVPGAVPSDPSGAHRRALMVAPPAADRAGEVDAALASQHQEPADVEVAILGPILASAAAAAKLAADLPVPPTAARAERLLLEPPRPVLKPTLVSSFQSESDATTGRRSRP